MILEDLLLVFIKFLNAILLIIDNNYVIIKLSGREVKVDISIIIPFYNGNKYMIRIMESLALAINEARKKDIIIEVIIVNDSPNIKIKNIKKNNFEIKVIENKENKGIHYSRIEGLKVSKGEYILFLDQDDEISENSLLSNYTLIKDNDVIIGNGLFFFKNKNAFIERNIYSTKSYHKQTVKELPYLLVRDLIVSPGQCLIKKSSIPAVWLNNTMAKNGADDYLLWLLLFNEKRKFSINHEVVFIHHDSGENLSFDVRKMKESLYNVAEILKSNENYPKWKINILNRTFEYKTILLLGSKSEFIKSSILNIDLFIYNVLFKMRYSGNVVSSREMRTKNESKK